MEWSDTLEKYVTVQRIFHKYLVIHFIERDYSYNKFE